METDSSKAQPHTCCNNLFYYHLTKSKNGSTTTTTWAAEVDNPHGAMTWAKADGIELRSGGII